MGQAETTNAAAAEVLGLGRLVELVVIVAGLVLIADHRYAVGDTVENNWLDFSTCAGIDPAPSARGFTT